MGHLTVAILNYNGADTLRASVQSVLDQKIRPHRFFVIDNASTDNSRQIAVDMGVEVIDADNKHQFITGLNTAIMLNQDLLFFMQNDVLIGPDCIAAMICNSPKDNFISQPVIYQLDKKIDNCGMDIIWPGYGQRRHNKWWAGNRYQNCGLVTTICFLTDNKGIIYDPEFAPAYYEDLDFATRSKMTGMQHVLVPNASAIHKGNHTFSQTLNKREISFICRINRKIFIYKNFGGLDLLLRLAVTACLDVMKKAFDVIRDRWISHNNRH